MQSFVLIDKEQLDKMQEAIIDALKQIILYKEEKNEEQNKAWLTLPAFLKHFDMSRSSWDRHYSKIIKLRDDGIKIWVYKPSMEKYLMDKSIN